MPKVLTGMDQNGTETGPGALTSPGRRHHGSRRTGGTYAIHSVHLRNVGTPYPRLDLLQASAPQGTPRGVRVRMVEEAKAVL